jgi:hypothetical protein
MDRGFLYKKLCKVFTLSGSNKRIRIKVRHLELTYYWHQTTDWPTIQWRHSHRVLGSILWVYLRRWRPNTNVRTRTLDKDTIGLYQFHREKKLTSVWKRVLSGFRRKIGLGSKKPIPKLEYQNEYKVVSYSVIHINGFQTCDRVVKKRLIGGVYQLKSNDILQGWIPLILSILL